MGKKTSIVEQTQINNNDDDDNDLTSMDSSQNEQPSSISLILPHMIQGEDSFHCSNDGAAVNYYYKRRKDHVYSIADEVLRIVQEQGAFNDFRGSFKDFPRRTPMDLIQKQTYEGELPLHRALRYGRTNRYTL